MRTQFLVPMVILVRNILTGRYSKISSKKITFAALAYNQLTNIACEFHTVFYYSRLYCCLFLDMSADVTLVRGK